jgi:DNA-binding NtrC family response regulator
MICPGTFWEEAERELVARTVALFGGNNKVRAAQPLGIGRTKLYALLKRHKGYEVNGRVNGRAHLNGMS